MLKARLYVKKKTTSKLWSQVSTETGMTLIEILVTLALIAIVGVVSFIYVFPSDVSKTKEDARNLVGTISLAYNEAILNQKFVRLVFDLDKKTYHIESSKTPFFVEKTSPEDKPETPVQESEATETETSPFEQKDDALFSPKTLHSGIKFKDIIIAHSEKPVDIGKEYMHFLPTGWAEPTIINLTNEEEKVFFSIEVNPLTGKSQIRDEYYQPEEKDFSSKS